MAGLTPESAANALTRQNPVAAAAQATRRNIARRPKAHSPWQAATMRLDPFSLAELSILKNQNPVKLRKQQRNLSHCI